MDTMPGWKGPQERASRAFPPTMLRTCPRGNERVKDRGNEGFHGAGFAPLGANRTSHRQGALACPRYPGCRLGGQRLPPWMPRSAELALFCPVPLRARSAGCRCSGRGGAARPATRYAGRLRRARHLSEGRPLVDPAGNRSRGYRVLKRGLDIAGALVLLAVLAPLMLAVFLALLVTTRGRPLFWQLRAGYLGRTFRMAKFRTMRLDAERLKAAVANEAGGPDLQEPPRPADHPVGPLPAKDQPRRNAAVVPRAPGPDVAGGPPAAGRAGSGPLRRLAAPPAGRHARPDLPLAGQRPLRRELRGLGPHGPVVRPHPRPLDRLQAIIAYAPPACSACRGAY